MAHTPLDRLHEERHHLLIQYQNLNKLVPPYRDPAHDEMLESVRSQKSEILDKVLEIDNQIQDLEIDDMFGKSIKPAPELASTFQLFEVCEHRPD